MLRLKTIHKSRISNRLAIFAAVLLLVSSLAGMGNPFSQESGARAAMASLVAVDKAVPGIQPSASAKAKKSKGFKVSLFLFRNN